jgi:hypothetical protein
MNRKYKYLLLIALLAITLSGIYILAGNSVSKVLGASEKSQFLSPIDPSIPNPTPSPTPTVIPFPTPTITPIPTKIPKPTATPTRKPTPTPTPKPTPVTSEKINGFIDKYSSQYSVDPNKLRHIALCESGFNSSAVNGQYVGLFQFNSTTWINLRWEIQKDPNPNLRFSAEESVQTAAYALARGRSGIWPHCYQ